MTGKELLRKIEELKGVPKKEMARALGFVSKTRTGHERVRLASFTNAWTDALLEAENIELEESSEKLTSLVNLQDERREENQKSFQDAMDYVLEKNHELYQRLA
jgi:predicted nucleic acid-binding protein